MFDTYGFNEVHFTGLLCTLFALRILLPHFNLGVNEMGILSGIPITNINRLQSLETEGKKRSH